MSAGNHNLIRDCKESVTIQGAFHALRPTDLQHGVSSPFSVVVWIYSKLYSDMLARVQKKSQLHGCEPEDGFLTLCQFLGRSKQFY